MGLFLTGEYRHAIDEKMRIRIPAKLREALGESPFITAGPDGSLIVLPYVDAMQQMEEAFGSMKINASSSSDAKQLREARLMASSAFRAVEDNQGRIVLPVALLKHAGITKNVVTIGAYKRAEIWSQENWDRYVAEDGDAK